MKKTPSIFGSVLALSLFIGGSFYVDNGRIEEEDKALDQIEAGDYRPHSVRDAVLREMSPAEKLSFKVTDEFIGGKHKIHEAEKIEREIRITGNSDVPDCANRIWDKIYNLKTDSVETRRRLLLRAAEVSVRMPSQDVAENLYMYLLSYKYGKIPREDKDKILGMIALNREGKLANYIKNCALKEFDIDHPYKRHILSTIGGMDAVKEFYMYINNPRAKALPDFMESAKTYEEKKFAYDRVKTVLYDWKGDCYSRCDLAPYVSALMEDLGIDEGDLSDLPCNEPSDCCFEDPAPSLPSWHKEIVGPYPILICKAKCDCFSMALEGHRSYQYRTPAQVNPR